MRRGFGYQQQSYGMRQEAQQRSFSMHQEAADWHSKDDYQNSRIISGVQIVPSLCLDSQFMKQNELFDRSHATHMRDGSWHTRNLSQNGWCDSGTMNTYYNHASGAKKLMPLKGVTNSSHGVMLNNALLENTEYETGFHEMHVPATMIVQETRYEHSVWGDHDGLLYGHGFDENLRWKRNGCFKSEWM